MQQIKVGELIINRSSQVEFDEKPIETEDNSEIEQEEKTPATDKILENISEKDRKIAEYTDKYNNETYGIIAYYLEIIQIYSIPVCIVGMTIGAFNLYIIGQKKLDKREQGFAMLMAFLVALVFFQVMPLIFALLSVSATSK